ncbi:hypothetical protein V492_07706 [Pseudogymnoascus sp. VKM F-4246]|nr:hypothetical protein V492_07706 [Pseudogymnoascus sp. VKM F-4246]
MEPLLSPQLLQELNRQGGLVLSNDSNSLRKPTDAIFTLSQQDDDYRLMLQKLEETLTASLKLSLTAQLAESSRPLDLPIWQVLAFTEPSWLIDPERLKQRSKALITSQRIRRVVAVQKSTNFWNDSRITEWASKDQSSLILLQGSHMIRDVIESTAVELIEHLQEQDQHTIWILNAIPNNPDGTIALWDGNSILKQIAIQMLKENASFNSLNDLANMVGLFRDASSTENWFQILATALKEIPQMYVVINLGALSSRISDAETWPQHFLRLFETLRKSSGTALKVALLSHCSFSNLTLTLETPIVPITTTPTPPGQTLTTRQSFGNTRGGRRMNLPILKKPKQLKVDNSKLEELGPQTTPVIGSVAGKSKRHSPGDWFTEIKSFERCIDVSRKDPDELHRRVRIAVLDTGVDIKHPDISRELQEGRIKVHDFVTDSINIEDLSGHGTHCTSVVAKFAPNAEIYVGRVFQTSQASDTSPEVLKKAIWHAADVWKVDIISLSLGFTEDHEELQEEIWKACANRVLIFAAAANNTMNENTPIRFPARMKEVICIFSSDAYGRPSKFNPAPRFDRPNFMFPGEHIEGAWPAYLNTNDAFEKKGSTYRYRDGTSCATPIAAAVAAGVLEFAWQKREYKIRKAKLLNHFSGMSDIFMKRMVDGYKVGDNSYHYVKAWKFISTDQSNVEIPVYISDTMDNVYC